MHQQAWYWPPKLVYLLTDLKTRYSNFVVSSLQDLVCVIRHWTACQCVVLFLFLFFQIQLSLKFSCDSFFICFLQCRLIFYSSYEIFFSKVLIQYSVLSKDHFVYASSQWEKILNCNIKSHWLGAYTKWSLHQHRNSHQGNKIILQLSCLQNENYYADEIIPYWKNLLSKYHTEGLFQYKDVLWNIQEAILK